VQACASSCLPDLWSQTPTSPPWAEAGHWAWLHQLPAAHGHPATSLPKTARAAGLWVPLLFEPACRTPTRLWPSRATREFCKYWEDSMMMNKLDRPRVLPSPSSSLPSAFSHSICKCMYVCRLLHIGRIRMDVTTTGVTWTLGKTPRASNIVSATIMH
jgi:hypothetical protein